MIDVTESDIIQCISSVIENFERDLYAKSEKEIEDCFFFAWDDGASIEDNIYNFGDSIELYKHNCEKWESKHHGHICVVERVRDKYIMPKITKFSSDVIKRIRTTKCQQKQ